CVLPSPLSQKNKGLSPASFSDPRTSHHELQLLPDSVPSWVFQLLLWRKGGMNLQREAFRRPPTRPFVPVLPSVPRLICLQVHLAKTLQSAASFQPAR